MLLFVKLKGYILEIYMQNSVFYVSDSVLLVAAMKGFNTEVLFDGQN